MVLEDLLTFARTKSPSRVGTCNRTMDNVVTLYARRFLDVETCAQKHKIWESAHPPASELLASQTGQATPKNHTSLPRENNKKHLVGCFNPSERM